MGTLRVAGGHKKTLNETLAPAASEKNRMPDDPMNVTKDTQDEQYELDDTITTCTCGQLLFSHTCTCTRRFL